MEKQRIIKLIAQGNNYYKQGRLLKAAAVLEQASCLLLARVKSRSASDPWLHLHHQIEKCKNKNIHAMIKTIPLSENE